MAEHGSNGKTMESFYQGSGKMNSNLKRSFQQKIAFNKKLSKRIKQVFGSQCKGLNDSCIPCKAWEFFEDIKYDVKVEE